MCGCVHIWSLARVLAGGFWVCSCSCAYACACVPLLVSSIFLFLFFSLTTFPLQEYFSFGCERGNHTRLAHPPTLPKLEERTPAIVSWIVRREERIKSRCIWLRCLAWSYGNFALIVCGSQRCQRCWRKLSYTVNKWHLQYQFNWYILELFSLLIVLHFDCSISNVKSHTWNTIDWKYCPLFSGDNFTR